MCNQQARLAFQNDGLAGQVVTGRRGQLAFKLVQIALQILELTLHQCNTLDQLGRLSLEQADRKSVVEGKRVSIREDLGGRRIITKKNTTETTTITRDPITRTQPTDPATHT